MIDLPAGPRTAPIKLSLTSMSTLASWSESRPGGGGGGGRGLPAVARPKELLFCMGCEGREGREGSEGWGGRESWESG